MNLTIESRTSRDTLVFRDAGGVVELQYLLGDDWLDVKVKGPIETPRLLSEAALDNIRQLLEKRAEGDFLDGQPFHLHDFPGTNFSLYVGNTYIAAEPFPWVLTFDLCPTDNPVTRLKNTSKTFALLRADDTRRLEKFLTSVRMRQAAKAGSENPTFGL